MNHGAKQIKDCANNVRNEVSHIFPIDQTLCEHSVRNVLKPLQSQNQRID